VFDESGTKIFATMGTGFKSPSLFQRFSSFGTEDLLPERSFGWDAGIEQVVVDAVKARAAYFYNDFENLIDFNPDTFLFENIASARTQGVELGLRSDFAETYSLDVNYTYTDTLDVTKGESLLRRPRNKVSALLRADFGRVDGGVEFLAFGKRFDNNFNTFPAERVALAGYGLLNLSCNVELTENLEVFARIDNLFDKEYEEVFELASAGRAGFVGLKGKLS
jgi:vitamin B12 transporter